MMTDNLTTKLRKALDFMRIWISNDAHLGESKFSYELEKAEGLRKLEAIEQAIAATLGSGTLTAEDVRSFLNRHSRFDDATWMHGSQELVFDEDDLQAMADELNSKFGRGTLTAEQVRKVLLLHLPHREYYSVEQTDAWQEIADELNAELGCGTCENIDILANIGFFKCSKCGISDNYVPNYCPNCGAKVLKNKK